MIIPEAPLWWDGEEWAAVRARNWETHALRPSIFYLKTAEQSKHLRNYWPPAEVSDPTRRPLDKATGQPNLDRLHIGVIRVGGRGDDLMTGANLVALKRKYPSAHVTLFARDNTGHLSSHPAIDRLVFGTNNIWRQIVRDFRSKFDAFIDLAYVPRLWVFHPDYKAWENEWRPRFEPLAWYYANFYASNRRIAELGKHLVDLPNEVLGLQGGVEDMTTFIGPQDRAMAKLLQQTIGDYITIHNGSACNRQTKCWPTQHWSEVVAWLIAHGQTVVQVGWPREELVAGAVDLRGQTNMGQVAGLIEGAALHLDTEGGPAHIAHAVGTQALVIFGPTPRVCFGYPEQISVETEVPCVGCWYRTNEWHKQCPNGYSRAVCMESIKPRRVIERLEEAMDAPGVICATLPQEGRSKMSRDTCQKNVSDAPGGAGVGGMDSSEGQSGSRLLVGIPTWNRLESLGRLLASIRVQTKQPDRILLVDDGVEADCFAAGDVEIIAGPGLGPPHSHQKALDYALKHGFEFVLRLDDDIVLESPDFIERLHRVLVAQPDVAAVGGCYPPPEHTDDVHSVECIGGPQFSTTVDGMMTNQRSLQFYRFDEESLVEVEHLYSSFMYRAAMMQQVGGFPLCYSRVGHREETDATIRLRAGGGKLLVDTGAVARHERCHTGGLRSIPANIDALQKLDNQMFCERWHSGELLREALG